MADKTSYEPIPYTPGDPQPRISNGVYRAIRIDGHGGYEGIPFARRTDEVERMRAALMRARGMLTEMRRTDFDCFTIAGAPATMTRAEAVVIAEYDAVLAEIGVALNA